MKTTMTFAVLGLVAMSVAGCYESYQRYGTDDASLETCEIEISTNALDGAEVTVDGVVSGGTVELGMGLHTFSATAVGYFSTSQTVEVTTECVPVELQLLPNLNGWYDLALDDPRYSRFLLQIRQDENSEAIVADDWREGTPTSEHPHEHFSGTVSFDREVHLTSPDSSRMELWGEWTPPRREGVARIEGAYDYISEEGGNWVAELRPVAP